MANSANQTIFFLDDELDVCKAVQETLEEAGFKVSYFTRPVDCLEQLRSQECDLLITDLKMPTMDGIELITEAKRLAPWIPVLIVTGYGDVPTAVTAIKAGAVDFIEKPLNRDNLVRKVKSILQQRTFSDSPKIEPLTQREMSVLKLILDSKTNKEMASLLKLSKRTVELHRHHLMHKFNVDNTIELVKQAMHMRLVR